MTQIPPQAGPTYQPGHVIIAGFGIVGRSVAETLDKVGWSYCVIELNAQTVQRVAKAGVAIIEGDARQEEVLQRAGILTARLLVLAMPDERDTLAALQTARQINPTIQVLVRCFYASAGMQAQKMGADAVVVAEQVVAHEFARVLRDSFLR